MPSRKPVCGCVEGSEEARSATLMALALCMGVCRCVCRGVCVVTAAGRGVSATVCGATATDCGVVAVDCGIVVGGTLWGVAGAGATGRLVTAGSFWAMLTTAHGNSCSSGSRRIKCGAGERLSPRAFACAVFAGVGTAVAGAQKPSTGSALAWPLEQAIANKASESLCLREPARFTLSSMNQHVQLFWVTMSAGPFHWHDRLWCHRTDHPTCTHNPQGTDKCYDRRP
jgi:hypothetical protein